MEKISLVIQGDRIINIENPFGEKSRDYICNNAFCFEKGNIYGIICEHGAGGESISLLLSGEEILDKEEIYIDGVLDKKNDIKNYGWYVGKALFSNGIFKKELSIEQLLNKAIKRYHRYENIDSIVEEFHLTKGRLGYGLSRNCEWEKWRASMALGYACNKLVYCFPWMDTLLFYDCMINSSVFRFFNKLKEEGAIIILPTSRVENVYKIADEIVKINSPRYNHIISENPYFIEHF